MTDWKAMFSDCTLCPRNCHADRLGGKTGYCGQTAQLRAARAALHEWEEPCISGRAGSGAVFFSGCPLRCSFCQNFEIAAGQAGKEISTDRLADIFLELQEKGANNINLVTPTHFVPLLVSALEKAKARGLALPIVYNTSSYEKVSTLRLLDGLVDIYLPDLKYVSAELSAALSFAPDYFAAASAAIGEMVRQVGEPVFEAPDGTRLDAAQMNDACMEDTGEEKPDEAGDKEPACDADFLMKRGVIVRHLALPGQAADSRRVLRYLHETYGNRIYISIMNQYTPMPRIVERLQEAQKQSVKQPQAARERSAVRTGGAEAEPGESARLLSRLSRRLTDTEYEALVDYAIDIGIENGFLQEGDTAKESFIPAFDGEGL